MSQYFMGIFCAVVCSFVSIFGINLTGTYNLSGTNNRSGTSAYHGQVIIESFGQNYRVTWLIGSTQCQSGIGILDDDQTILSVAFWDSGKNDYGIASFDILSDYELEGKWASYNSSSYGRERLMFVSPFTNY